MRILLVASDDDRAGCAIHERVVRCTRGEPHIGEHEVSLERIEGSLLDWTPPSGFDLIIFLSKHSAASNAAAMCVHAIGNFGEAHMGGRDHMLVPTHPGMLTTLYRRLRAAEPHTALGAYTVSLEAVHHGPYTTTPSLFYELGSGPEHWADADAARIMGDVLVAVLAGRIERRSSFFAFGSNHYCAGFENHVRTMDFAGSCARYALDEVSEHHLRWIADHYDTILLKTRSMGAHKRRIIGMLEEARIAYERV